MPSYFCRIDVSYETFEPMLSYLTEECSKIALYEHHAGQPNVHIHCYMTDYKPSIDTLKRKINVVLQRPRSAPKGNSFWSFKTEYKTDPSLPPKPIDDGCITYMSKGIYEPSFILGFTQEAIQQYKLNWIDFKTKNKQQKLTQYIVKESQQQAKLRQEQLIKLIIERCKNDFSIKNILINLRQTVIVENRTIIGRYKVRDYVDTILAHKDANSWLMSMETFSQYRT